MKSSVSPTFVRNFLTVVFLSSSVASKVFAIPIQPTDATTIPAQAVGFNVPKSYASIEALQKAARYNELVRFQAEVQKIHRDNDLVIRDQTGSLELDVNEMPLPLKVGDIIQVTGRVDREKFSIEVSANAVEHKGKVFNIQETNHDDR